MKKFSKKDRATWSYFWAHWCAFQMVALNLGVWKFKYLFHDWYKPWLKMLGIPYEKIRWFHRHHSKHHLEWWVDYNSSSNKCFTDFDWDALIIDWECSQYTKEECTRNARQEMEHVLPAVDDDLRYLISVVIPDRLEKLGL